MRSSILIGSMQSCVALALTLFVAPRLHHDYDYDTIKSYYDYAKRM